MKILYAGIITLGSLFATVATADQDMMNTQPQGTNIQQEKEGEARVRDNEDRGADPKMKEQIQEDWRDDAEKRRESDVMKPEQRG
ncbi:hypothetical protein CXK93_05990 [Stutzerimonas decontaminans]|jgi:hypothetical protein|uniref:Uncharacterized protein n=2 Tax=Stutzerimonas TaxID=2901164 RepID=A0ABX4W1M5_9GAMM|nr:hypothetical protein [Stutzerimonas decontaminans]AHY42072.1 hypothetical protein UIB01_06085 [Stutzerimonas decontaminans]MCQ4244348.1 hypothetical protein [Stutzerimonas decontaminans]MCW8158451.1 hypothetical protein [Stutzerimonas stutzeri]PNF86340.1 hypothetical protein CXK93_05990 [Stutzerimonas decontaminans]